MKSVLLIKKKERMICLSYIHSISDIYVNTQKFSQIYPNMSSTSQTVLSNNKRINTDLNIPTCKKQKIDEDVSSIVDLLHYPGTSHPTSKQYLIYDRANLSMISKTARCWCRKYQKVLIHVNPDVFNVNS